MSSLGSAARIGTILALATILAGGHGGVSSGGLVPLGAREPAAEALAGDPEMLSAAIENLAGQAAKLAAQPGAACPQEFAALETGRPLRISLFYGYDEHDGKVHDRAHAQAMAHLLTSPCRGQLSTCGFAPAARSTSAVRLTRALDGRTVEVNLFTSSLPEGGEAEAGRPAGELEQERLSRAVKDRFLQELVESDIVFYMGHSRLGGSIGFDRQMGVTTAINSILRLPMVPVLAALRQRPTRLKLIGMFSCSSTTYFRRDFEAANPALAMILTTGEVDYGPAEQASLGALEAILAKNCGHAFHRSMISASEPDPAMTYFFRGR